ncbi:cell division protein CrgA, partial [Streptomyces sp. NPDC093982]
LAWIVVFYVTDGSLPLDALGNWNIVVGRSRAALSVLGFRAAPPCAIS